MLTEREIAATRIVAIQATLLDSTESVETRIRLADEQRRLWDSNYSGKPYDAIAHDVWMVRKRSAYG